MYCDLNFDFRFVNFTGNAKYPDTAEWPVEKQGKTCKSYITYSAGIHRYAVLIRNHYRGTGDQAISEYMCYLKTIGLRSLKYYTAHLFYEVLPKFDNLDFCENKDWMFHAAHIRRQLDRCLLAQYSLDSNFLQDYHANCGVDGESKGLYHFGIKCPVAGVNEGYVVKQKYQSKVTKLDMLKHFGFAKLSLFLYNSMKIV